MLLSKAAILSALSKIKDPISGKDIVSANLIKSLTIKSNEISFLIEINPSKEKEYRKVQSLAEIEVKKLKDNLVVRVFLTAHSEEEPTSKSKPPNLKIGRHPESQTKKLKPLGVNQIIAIGSGKGGVGKSTLTANIAVALSQRGLRIGLLDADIYGPSQPRMMGVSGKPEIGGLDGKSILPLHGYGITLMSMGFLVDANEAVIWRGPMLHKALEQFLTDVFWDDLDYLLIDLPPGTGDIALSLAQFLPRSELYVVTTPQPAAQKVAQRAAYMAKNVNLEVKGVIENMSWFTGDDNKRYYIFGHGGGEDLANRLEVPLLGQIPLVQELREGSDSGKPLAATNPDSEAGKVFAEIVETIDVELAPTRRYNQELKILQ